jgi:hypothetical protein
MKNLKTLLVLVFFMAPLAIFAQTENIDVTNPANIVVLLTPFIVFLAVKAFTFFKPLLPGWILGFLVPVLATLAAFLTNAFAEPDTSFILQLGLGLSATFVNEAIKLFTTSKKR